MGGVKIIRVVAAIFLALAQPAKASESLTTSQLLSYFQASCPSQGEWTKTAISHAQSLIRMLDDIKNDPDCVTLAGTGSQLRLIEQRVSALEKNPSEKLLQGLQRQEQELVMHISSASDPAEAAFLRSQLLGIHLERSQVSSNYSYERSLSGRGGDLGQLVHSVGMLMNQAVANQACMIKNPALLTSFATVAGAVAAAVATSGVSLAAAAGVHLLGNIVEFARGWKISKQIRGVNLGITHLALRSF